MSADEAASLSALRPLPELVSVVIPARDAATVLPGQLAALSRQQYPGAWEVVVADNGSSDDTVAVAIEWRPKLPRLRVADASSRKGINHARNVGAAEARGDFLIFCDADDSATPGWLLAMAKASHTADLIGGYPEPYVVHNQHARTWRPPQPRDRLPEMMGYRPYAVGASLGVHAQVFHAVGGFNEAYGGGGDEVEFCWRAQNYSYTMAFAPDAVMRYRQREQLWPVVRQGYCFGRADAQLMRDFRPHGLRPVPVKAAARSWYHLIRRTPELIYPQRAGRWWYGAAWRLGRLVGSIRYRVRCL
ncbi:glycosyltransferase family 2 protein [Nocardia sp. 2YAB30]|uniref:glycosyltransferase family 2 protein n=1 Tax=unclassified Nocardia TaxID=2637762 RepID=UPI003F957434